MGSCLLGWHAVIVPAGAAAAAAADQLFHLGQPAGDQLLSDHSITQ